MKRVDLPDTVAGRRRMMERLDRRAVEEEIKKCGLPAVPEDVDARCSHLRRGWYWGSQEFAGKLRKLSEKLMKERKRSSRAYRKTPQVTAHSEEQAERGLAEGLKAAGLTARDLPDLKGSDPRKLAMAELLWKRTTVSQEWIAEKLSMHSAANVSQQLRRNNQAKTQASCLLRCGSFSERLGMPEPDRFFVKIRTLKPHFSQTILGQENTFQLLFLKSAQVLT